MKCTTVNVSHKSMLIFCRRDYKVDDSSMDTSADRLVKWINRRNVHRRFQQHELKTMTKLYLYGQEDAAASTLDNAQADSLFMDDDEDSHSKWECLPDISNIELCSDIYNTPSASDRDDCIRANENNPTQQQPEK